MSVSVALSSNGARRPGRIILEGNVVYGRRFRGVYIISFIVTFDETEVFR